MLSSSTPSDVSIFRRYFSNIYGYMDFCILLPLAPHEWTWYFIHVESIIIHFTSGSSLRASSISSHIHLLLHLEKRLCVFFQFPYSGVRSLQGTPVLNIYKSELIYILFSTPFLPLYSLLHGRILFILSQDFIFYVVPM